MSYFMSVAYHNVFCSICFAAYHRISLFCGWMISHHACVTFSLSFIHWWALRLVLHPSCCEQSRDKQGYAGISLACFFIFFVYIPRSKAADLNSIIFFRFF
jgi:hypothetical protein